MALIRLRVCAGWSEPLLVAHTTFVEISCRGSFRNTYFRFIDLHATFAALSLNLSLHTVPHISMKNTISLPAYGSSPSTNENIAAKKCQLMLFCILRIHHGCEGGIEKSVPRLTDWHHEDCRVMRIRVSFICIVVGQGNPTRGPE